MQATGAAEAQLLGSDDTELIRLIESQLSTESNLRKVYNDFRKQKGLEPIDFDKTFSIADQSDPVTLRHCMEFVLKHVRERNASEVPKLEGEDEYKGMLLEGMGINSHQARKYHDEL